MHKINKIVLIIVQLGLLNILTVLMCYTAATTPFGYERVVAVLCGVGVGLNVGTLIQKLRSHITPLRDNSVTELISILNVRREIAKHNGNNTEALVIDKIIEELKH